jgi:hypothetical protein
MGVVECETCGTVIDDLWSACPACGASPGMARTEAAVPETSEPADEVVDLPPITAGPADDSLEPAPLRSGVAAEGDGTTLHLHWNGGRSLDSRSVYVDGERVGKVGGLSRRALDFTSTIAPGCHSLAIGNSRAGMSEAVEVAAEPRDDLFYECGYGVSLEDVLGGIVDVALGGHAAGHFWVRPVKEPPTHS